MKKLLGKGAVLILILSLGSLLSLGLGRVANAATLPSGVCSPKDALRGVCDGKKVRSFRCDEDKSACDALRKAYSTKRSGCEALRDAATYRESDGEQYSCSIGPSLTYQTWDNAEVFWSGEWVKEGWKREKKSCQDSLSDADGNGYVPS